MLGYKWDLVKECCGWIDASKEAEYPKHTILGTIIGVLKKSISRSSNTQLQIMSSINTIIEFLKLGYPTKLIIKALHYTKLPIFIITKLREILKVM